METILRLLDLRFENITTIIKETKDLEAMMIKQLLGSLQAHEEKKKKKQGFANRLLKTDVQQTKKDESFNNNRSQHGRDRGQGWGHASGQGWGSNKNSKYSNHNNNNYEREESSIRERGRRRSILGDDKSQGTIVTSSGIILENIEHPIKKLRENQLHRRNERRRWHSVASIQGK